MSLKNTSTSYGSVAKWLHWSVALLFISAYVVIYYREWFIEPKTPASSLAIHTHFSLGISVGVFVLLRILWTLSNSKPELPLLPTWQKQLSNLSHGLLYVFMILMPLTGYMGTGADAKYFQLAVIPKFKDTALYQHLIIDTLGLTWETFEPVVDAIHKISGAYIVWVLVLVHITAALYHHFIQKDAVLKRML